MADNRWDKGKPEVGQSFHPGFISPWNANVRNFSDFETLQTNPETTPPATMAGQMDGDENTSFGGGEGRRGRK